MKITILIIFLISVLITSTAFFFKYKPQTNHSVLDCSIGPGKCVVGKLEYSIKECRATSPSNPPNPIDILDCLLTKKVLKKITYIADSDNYISGPFTEKHFNLEFINIDLNEPWDLEFLPDGSMLVTERRGRIVHIDKNLTTEVYKVEPIVLAETGLLGMAIDPDFSSNNYVYIYYTYKLDNSDPLFLIPEDDPTYISKRRVINKISRLTLKNGTLKDEKVILDNIPGSSWHSGGRLDFGPDGKLYATTGDASDWILTQDPKFLGGKILRLNTDGAVPGDNPFPESYTYSMGHRNPQGLAWHPATNELFASEHGPRHYDEINHIKGGKNYGWGTYKCDEFNYATIISRILGPSPLPPNEKVVFPVVCIKSWTMAPSGIEFVSDPKSPWYGSLFVASLRGKHLHRYEIENDKIVVDEIFYVSEGKDYTKQEDIGKISSRIRDVEYYDGSLYVIGDVSGLVKLTPK